MEPVPQFNRDAVQGLRTTLRMTQYEFARRVGYTPETIRNWERGRSTPMGYHVHTMYELSQENNLGVPPLYS